MKCGGAMGVSKETKTFIPLVNGHGKNIVYRNFISKLTHIPFRK